MTKSGPSVAWQEENTVLGPRLTVRVWEQPGGSARLGRMRRTAAPGPGSTRQWHEVTRGSEAG